MVAKKPPVKRRRVRVSLTIDPDVWARCQEYSKLAAGDLSWSAIADFSFATMCDELDELGEKFKQLRPGATPDEAGDLMALHFGRKIHAIQDDVYAQITSAVQADKAAQEPPK